jgi:nicotinamidase-related amidase
VAEVTQGTGEEQTPEDRVAMLYLVDYFNDFLDKRAVGGVSGELRAILFEMVVDAFHDGARYAEAARQEGSRVILP